MHQPDNLPFEPTRAAGLARLADFAPRAGLAYGEGRNTDFGPNRRHNVSTLSPWLRHRLIEEEEVLRAVLGVHSPQEAQRFVQEVLWRTYFKGHLETHPAIWRRYCADRDRLIARLGEDASLADRVSEAVDGRTGIDAFDAWMRELATHGYLHNHARMWLASIWIFTLKLPWQLGADHTLRHFVDGDPASNTLSWRWVGGLHSVGKTYLATAENIAAFTDGRFRPEGLAKVAEPLAEPEIGPALALPPPDALPTWRVGLLVTEEDCHPESFMAALAPVAIGGASIPSARSPLPVSPLVARFAGAALDDALARARTRWQAPAERLADLSAPSLLAFAKRHDLDAVVTAWAPMGPVADALAAAAPRLAEAGARLMRLRRGYDSACWPLATRGYFAMRKRIPELLQSLGLTAA